MFYQKRMCVIGAMVLSGFIVIQFVVTEHFKTFPQHVNEMSTYPKFMQYEGFYPTVTNSVQPEKRLTKADMKFDLDSLKKKFKNETCLIRKLTLMTGKSSYRTALLSFPASGNTWTRHLIHQLTGFRTCAATTKAINGEIVSIDSINSKACVVYKSHLSTILGMAHFNKAVIIIRDPLYALKSFFHYTFGEQKGKALLARNNVEKHTVYADISLFLSPKWTSFVKSQLSVWRNNYMSWFKHFKQHCMIVVYENMKQNLLPELLRIVRYLEIPVKPKDMWCTLVNKEGQYHRISRNNTETSVLSLFSAKQKEEIIKTVCQVSNAARCFDINLNISQYLVNLSDTPNTVCLSEK